MFDHKSEWKHEEREEFEEHAERINVSVWLDLNCLSFELNSYLGNYVNDNRICVIVFDNLAK